jgi:transposase
LQRAQFGRRSEKLDPEQLLLALEDTEQAVAGNEAADDKKDPAGARTRGDKRRVNRGALPAHLPRVDVTITPEDTNCPCCRAPMHMIGEETSGRLDVVPAQFRVIVTRRPKYACRACEEAVVQAPAPERLIKGGLPTEAMVAYVLVAEYAWHAAATSGNWTKKKPRGNGASTMTVLAYVAAAPARKAIHADRTFPHLGSNAVLDVVHQRVEPGDLRGG